MTTTTYHVAKDALQTITVPSNFIAAVTPEDYGSETQTYVLLAYDMTSVYLEQAGYTAAGVNNPFQIGYGYNVYNNGYTTSANVVTSGTTLYVRPRIAGIKIEITPM